MLRTCKVLTLAIGMGCVTGCGPPQYGASIAGVSAARGDVTVRATLAVSASPDVVFPAAGVPFVRGERVPFDGVTEGLQWPALIKAIGRPTSGVVTLEVSREVALLHVLRACWSLGSLDLRVQSRDETGILHAIALPKKRGARAPKGCHAAVFRRPNGTFHVVAAGGPYEVGGDLPTETLVATLAAESATCPFSYVAFGATSSSMPWGPIFDAVVAIDRAKAVGTARYVLAEPGHAK